MRVVYNEAARQEGIDASVWYEESQQGLGIRFLIQWKDAETRMEIHPEIHRRFEGELRKCRFQAFPYTLVFRIRSEELQVIAVMHMSRRPRYWGGRA